MTSLGDEFRKREQEKPDQFTLAWWNERFTEVIKGYRGATHAINQAIAEMEDVSDRVEQIDSRETKQRSEIEAIRAKIGEIQESIVIMTERVDRMAEFLTKMKNGGSKT